MGAAPEPGQEEGADEGPSPQFPGDPSAPIEPQEKRERLGQERPSPVRGGDWVPVGWDRETFSTGISTPPGFLLCWPRGALLGVRGQKKHRQAAFIPSPSLWSCLRLASSSTEVTALLEAADSTCLSLDVLLTTCSSPFATDHHGSATSQLCTPGRVTQPLWLSLS